MKKIILAIYILFFAITAGYCQEAMQPLQLIIKSDKQIYDVGEEINITVSIRNESNNTIKIYSPDYWGVSDIIVTNSQGIPIKSRGLKIYRRASDTFMTVPPNESRAHTFDNLLWFHCGGAWQFIDEAQLKPDTYKIYVTVTNPPVDKCGGGKKFEKTDLSDILTSNTMTIEVKEKVARKIQ